MPRAMMEPTAHRGRKATQAHRGRRVALGRKVTLALRGRRVALGRKATQAHRGRKVRLARKVTQDHRGRKVRLARKATQDHRGRKVKPGAQGIAGARGELGTQGESGTMGIQGLQGERGEAGPQGPPGSQELQGQAGGPFDFADLAERIKPSVVRVDSPSWEGSGFFVAPSCSVVTARHIMEVEQSSELHDRASVELQSGQVVPYELQDDIASKDLVVLRATRAVNCQELTLSDVSVRMGEAVLIMGYPGLHDNSGLAAAPAHVINADATDFSADFLLHGYSHYGTSGGPIVNADGQLVGMLGGSFAVEKDADGNWIFNDYLNWAVDVAKHLR